MVLDGHEFGFCSEKKYPQPTTMPGKELLLGVQELEGSKGKVLGGCGPWLVFGENKVRG